MTSEQFVEHLNSITNNRFNFKLSSHLTLIDINGTIRTISEIPDDIEDKYIPGYVDSVLEAANLFFYC